VTNQVDPANQEVDMALYVAVPTEVAKGSSTIPNSVPRDLWLTPMEYMLNVMNNPLVPAERRDKMAAALMAYCHSKQGELGKKEQRQADAGRVAGGGKYASPPAPGGLRRVS